MKTYVIKYRAIGQDFIIGIRSETINNAIMKFAIDHVDIEEIYSVKEIGS